MWNYQRVSIGKSITCGALHDQLPFSKRRRLESVAAALVGHETDADFKGKEQAEEVVHDLQTLTDSDRAIW